MAAIDTVSWGVSISPEKTLSARTPRESWLRRLGRLLAQASLAFAMTDPQIVAMLAADEEDRSQDGR